MIQRDSFASQGKGEGPGPWALRLGGAALVLAASPALFGCSQTTSYVHSDTALGRVVVYRNGVAYFERSARVDGDTLHLSVPADQVDDFLKSLTVVDAKTGEPAPVSYPTEPAPKDSDGLVDMEIKLGTKAPRDIRLSYVTEAPSWKPSYRVVLGDPQKVRLQAWAIIDNTSGEDWKNVKLGVGSSSALSFRFDLHSVRTVRRDTLRADSLFAVAPPTGGAAYGSQPEQVARVLGELTDDTLVQLAGGTGDVAEATKHAERKAPSVTAASPPLPRKESKGGGQRSAPAKQEAPVPGFDAGTIAQQLQSTPGSTIVVEGYADEADADKHAASLERANRARDQLVRLGAPPDRVIAVGNGQQAGRRAGVRIVEAPAPEQKDAREAKAADASRGPGAFEPIGTSHFESTSRMTVPRGTSAMVSILESATEGEVVYYYDPESPRGNETFPFRAVRLRNPTDSVLESGPVTVFGQGKFIGEGLSDPIPARSVAFVPFALDRQVVVEKAREERDEIARILTVQRGVFSTEVRHVRSTKLVLHNRMNEPAKVFVRHTVPEGYELRKAPPAEERLAGAPLLRVELGPGEKREVVIEEATPLFKTTDIRTPDGMELVRAHLSSAAMADPNLRAAVEALVELQKEIGNHEQRIATMREQMSEYRARMDELHAQLVTLKAVKTAGPLMKALEKKLEETNDKLSKATIALVTLQEKLMVARIRFQDGVAELTLEPKKEAPAAAVPSAKPGPGAT